MSFGNNIFALLTGLHPYEAELVYEDVDEYERLAIKAIKNGVTPYIDPRYKNRSPEERLLVEVMERCFAYNPDERPSIFDVVSWLQKGHVVTT